MYTISLRTKVILLAIAIICFAITSFAQGPGFETDVEDTPIDGGATALIAIAAGYGAKKMADRKPEHKKKQ